MSEDPHEPSAARATLRVFALGDEPRDDPHDLMARTTAEERIGIVRELTERAWRLSGRPLPSYSRAEIPVRVTRLA